MSGLGQHQESAATKAATARVAALATALKLTTIYPESHPRVAAGVEGFLAELKDASGPYTLLLRESTFHVGGERIAADQPATAWLAERFRDAGLRGVEIDPKCEAAEALQFAAFLRRARRAEPGGTSPAACTTPHLRALPLVFSGYHSEDAAALAANATPLAEPGSGLPPAVAAALATIRTSDSYRDQLARLDRAAAGDDGDGSLRDLDLLATIGKMIPAEIANNPEAIPGIVQSILDTVQSELHVLASGQRKIRGGRLLVRAVELARSFFGRASTATPATRVLPAGRPEDARFVADLDALLREYAALPVDDRPATALIEDSLGCSLGHELVGVCLHTLAKAPAAADASPRLLEALQRDAAARPDLLDAYLRGRGAEELTPLRRLQLIRWLTDAGHAELVRERGYVDQEMVTKNFPESFGVVVKVYGNDPQGVQFLRVALGTLARTLSFGGIDTAVRSGVLMEPGVAAALLATGGAEANALVLGALDANPRALRPLVVDHLRRQALPEPVAVLLRIHPNAESLPTQYVRNLFASFAQQRYEPAIRTATGELLREALIADRALAPADRLAAIDHLYLVPGAETQRLLARLAGTRRFRFWDRGARTLRRHASKALAELGTGRTR